MKYAVEFSTAQDKRIGDEMARWRSSAPAGSGQESAPIWGDEVHIISYATVELSESWLDEAEVFNTINDRFQAADPGCVVRKITQLTPIYEGR